MISVCLNGHVMKAGENDDNALIVLKDDETTMKMIEMREFYEQSGREKSLCVG
jgi:hypothetical protein